LRPRESQVFDRPLDLRDGPIALEWIDTGETHELLWVAAHDLGDGIVPQRLLAGGRLGVPRQQHADDVLPGVVVGDFLDVAELDIDVEVLLHGSAVFADCAIHKLGNGQVDMEVYRAGHPKTSSPLQQQPDTIRSDTIST